VRRLPLPGTANFKRNELRLLRRSVFLVTCLLIPNSAVGQTGQLEIKAPWARATPGQPQNGAAYLTIVSPTADRLTAASSQVAKKAELHAMSMERGVMRMRPFTATDIPARRAIGRRAWPARLKAGSSG